jgi:hypothetical protein
MDVAHLGPFRNLNDEGPVLVLGAKLIDGHEWLKEIRPPFFYWSCSRGTILGKEPVSFLSGSFRGYICFLSSLTILATSVGGG